MTTEGIMMYFATVLPVLAFGAGGFCGILVAYAMEKRYMDHFEIEWQKRRAAIEAEDEARREREYEEDKALHERMHCAPEFRPDWDDLEV